MHGLKKNLLFTPGPVDIPPEVLIEQALPIVHHRTPEFMKDYLTVIDSLKRIIGLDSGKLYLMPSSGTGAMEAAVVNLFQPGERVLVACNGVFSERFAEICRTYRLDVKALEFEWGKPVDPILVENELKQDSSIKGVLAVFHDTSTGVVNDLAAIGNALSHYSALFVVDAVTGTAVSPLQMDAWHIACVVGASQKGLMAPPGVSYIALNNIALEACQKNPMPRYYYDIRRFESALQGGITPSPWTPPVVTVRALKKSLEMILSGGIEDYYHHQRDIAKSVQVSLEAMGLNLPVERSYRSQAVTLVLAPQGISPKKIVSEMKEEWGITLADALGRFKDIAFRVGHIGFITILDVVATMFALEMTLNKFGWTIEPGVSARAIYQYLRENDTFDEPQIKRG
jgi:serine---pyruvate transaminase